MTEAAIPSVVSQDEWFTARKQLLQKERELTHAMDELAKARRQLPMTKVTKDYKFTDLNGREFTLPELFGESKQLIVYHLMFGPDATVACTGCSTILDGFGDIASYLQYKSTRLIAIARGKTANLSSFAEKMGWKFPIYTTNSTSTGDEFQLDYQALSDAERKPVVHNYMAESELVAAGLPWLTTGDQPGLSVFFKHDEGAVYHSYSTYARGLDNLAGVYRLLDLTPLGRQEKKGENIGHFPLKIGDDH